MTSPTEPRCPVCSGELAHCYGFAGGGLGPYSICTGCDRIITKLRTDSGDCFENVRAEPSAQK